MCTYMYIMCTYMHVTVPHLYLRVYRCTCVQHCNMASTKGHKHRCCSSNPHHGAARPARGTTAFLTRRRHPGTRPKTAAEPTTAVRVVTFGRRGMFHNLCSSALFGHFHLDVLAVAAFRVTSLRDPAGAPLLVQWPVATDCKRKVQRRVVVVHFGRLRLHTKVCVVAVRGHWAHMAIACVQIRGCCFVFFVQPIDASPIFADADDGTVRVDAVVVITLELVVVVVRCSMAPTLVQKERSQDVLLVTQDLQTFFAGGHVNARGAVAVVLAARFVEAGVRGLGVFGHVAVVLGDPFLAKSGFERTVNVLSLDGPCHSATRREFVLGVGTELFTAAIRGVAGVVFVVVVPALVGDDIAGELARCIVIHHARERYIQIGGAGGGAAGSFAVGSVDVGAASVATAAPTATTATTVLGGSLRVSKAEEEAKAREQEHCHPQRSKTTSTFKTTCDASELLCSVVTNTAVERIDLLYRN